MRLFGASEKVTMLNVKKNDQDSSWTERHKKPRVRPWIVDDLAETFVHFFAGTRCQPACLPACENARIPTICWKRSAQYALREPLKHLIQPVIHLHFTSVSPGALVQVFDPALIRKIILLCHIAPSSTSSLIKSKANGPGDVNMLLCRRAVMLKIMHQRDGHARNAAE